MIILVAIGRILIALALALFGLGVWLWLSGADIMQPAGRLWYDLHVGSLNMAQVAVQRWLNMPALWDDFFVARLLVLPAWEAILWIFMAFMVLGGVLVAVARRRQRRKPTFK